ncbi:MAG: restriction endonuclease subunit R [Hormoscilla sp. GM7CHS1pb]|nr:restriction endonuclease subunit R [Hormoscilla sp. GM7CHS1pb]
MITIKAKDITINEVHKLLKFQEVTNINTFTTWLSLEPLTEVEQQELAQIQQDFWAYLSRGKVLEGLVKALTTFPLMRLAGFYRSPIALSLEQHIADTIVEDEDTTITGQLDIVAVNKEQPLRDETFFWVLVIEAKNSSITTYMGLPQLLTYAYQSLERQASVWGLATNGVHYQFAYLDRDRGNGPTYELMPELNLMDAERSPLLLQVLKAICKLHNSVIAN